MTGTNEHHGWRAFALQGVPVRTTTWLFPLAAVAVAGLTFVADTLTDYEIAAATFYVVVVLLASRFSGSRGLLLVGSGCIGLTILSYFLTKDGNFHTGVINTAISILAIAGVTSLAIRTGQAQARADEAQAQLARVTRITTLGEMGAAIAHEVNQPLAAIVTNVDACHRWMASAPPNLNRIATTIADIALDANRASAIIARIRALTSNSAPKKQMADINDVIRQATSLIEPQMRIRSIVWRYGLAAPLPLVLIDPIQLQQVILNLLVNAIEAIDGEDGTVQITSERRLGSIHIVVADNGHGLTIDQMDRIFDPFHSTKTGGMGIGLTICRSIVEAHGGAIRAIPGMPRGLAMAITLPIAIGAQP